MVGLLVPGVAASEPALCPAEILAAVRAPATPQDRSVTLDCSLQLQPGDRISKQLILAGPAATNATIACSGAVLDGSRDSVNAGRDLIVVRSVQTDDGRWLAPADIAISGCTVYGSIRVYGMSQNGEGEALRASSVIDTGHTQRAQTAAPTRIDFSAMTIIGDARIPFYIGPGSTAITLKTSLLGGTSNGPAIYLDTESGSNVIEANTIETRTRSRELLAIDGSADNLIATNIFAHADRGGVFVYRNCGEGGTVRHQHPTGNTITGNTFVYDGILSAVPAVWLGSRNAISMHCAEDNGYPFGSSADNGDFATGNTIENNRLTGRVLPLAFVGDDTTNTLQNND